MSASTRGEWGWAPGPHTAHPPPWAAGHQEPSHCGHRDMPDLCSPSSQTLPRPARGHTLLPHVEATGKGRGAGRGAQEATGKLPLVLLICPRPSGPTLNPHGGSEAARHPALAPARLPSHPDSVPVHVLSSPSVWVPLSPALLPCLVPPAKAKGALIQEAFPTRLQPRASPLDLCANPAVSRSMPACGQTRASLPRDQRFSAEAEANRCAARVFQTRLPNRSGRARTSPPSDGPVKT